MHAWAAYTLPYLEQVPAARLYQWDKVWSDPANQSAVSVTIPVFVCPSAPTGRLNSSGGQAYGDCDYTPVANLDANLIATGLLAPWQGDPSGVMDSGRGYQILDITDGTSQTLLVTEDAGRPQVWRKGRQQGTMGVSGWAAANSWTPINLDGVQLRRGDAVRPLCDQLLQR